MAKQHNTHGSPELDVDATKLAAMGADPWDAEAEKCVQNARAALKLMGGT